MQFDCVEFIESLLEHFWKELPIADSLNETIFGGLAQETYHCECGTIEKKPLQRLSDVLSIPVIGNSAQTCIDAYLASEQLSRKCQKCNSNRSSKSIEIVLPPSTLILHFKRYTFNETLNKTIKLHTQIFCPLALSLKSNAVYQLDAVINHIGESSTSGHYTILLNDSINKKLIMIDDTNIIHNASLSDVKDVSYVAIYRKV